jgi:hypothetical protein
LSACTAEEAIERGGCGPASPPTWGDPMTGAPGSHPRPSPGAVVAQVFVHLLPCTRGRGVGTVGAFGQAAAGSDRQRHQDTTITVNAEDTR